MEEVIHRFFRHCPACGHRFEIHLMGKKLEGEDTSEATIMPSLYVPGGGFVSRPGISPLVQPAGYSALKESTEPILIDIEDFDYTYKCGHCGHVWHELRPTERRIYTSKDGRDELVTDNQDEPTHEEEEEDEAADMA